MAPPQKESRDVDAELRAESERLLAEMDSLIQRARVILGTERGSLAELREHRQKLRQWLSQSKKR